MFTSLKCCYLCWCFNDQQRLLKRRREKEKNPQTDQAQQNARLLSQLCFQANFSFHVCHFSILPFWLQCSYCNNLNTSSSSYLNCQGRLCVSHCKVYSRWFNLIFNLYFSFPSVTLRSLIIYMLYVQFWVMWYSVISRLVGCEFGKVM